MFHANNRFTVLSFLHCQYNGSSDYLPNTDLGRNDASVRWLVEWLNRIAEVQFAAARFQ
jgi:hypothetical protein